MDSIEVQLGESLGVLVEHTSELPPPRLISFLEKTFGSVSYSSAYVLVSDDSMATIVFFGEAAVTTRCYLTLEGLTMDSEKPTALRAVAWVSETAAAVFEKKPYVRHRWVPPKPTSDDDACDTACGYITVFWKRADSAAREDVRSVAEATGQLVDSFSDEKEGGRLFLRFRTESGADEYRRLIVSKHESLRRDVSYGSAAEYKLAAGNASVA